MTQVLVFCEYGSVNGGEQSLLSIVPHLKSLGFHMTVATPTTGELSAAVTQAGVSHFPLRIHEADGRRMELETVRQCLFGAIDDLRPDLVHANSLSMSRMLGPVAHHRRLPSLGHLRDIIRISQTAMDDLNANSRLVAVSHATRDWHVDGGLEAKKTHVVYNGIDVQKLSPSPPTGYLHKELGLAPDAKLVGCIGQLGLRKGLDTLLRAAREFVPRIPDTHVLIVGKRFSQKQESLDFEAQLMNDASTLPLDGHVHFIGWRSDVPKLLNELSLLVHTARQEPLGRVLLEAAACGVPVVATDVGGTREIFPTESAGARLVNPDDSLAVADAIVSLLENQITRDELGRAGRTRIERAFDAKDSAAAIATHYRSILDY